MAMTSDFYVWGLFQSRDLEVAGSSPAGGNWQTFSFFRSAVRADPLSKEVNWVFRRRMARTYLDTMHGLLADDSSELLGLRILDEGNRQVVASKAWLGGEAMATKGVLDGTGNDHLY